VKEAYETGRGKIILRARHRLKRKRTARQNIIISEIPYQVNKATLIENIADLVKRKKS
jgi:DNA gyrase subunit A